MKLAIAGAASAICSVVLPLIEPEESITRILAAVTQVFQTTTHFPG